MSGGFYRINRDICAKYHLVGREAMVYNALLYLCARGPYTGSAQDIADFSFCGTKMTTLRMLSLLEKKGLIMRDNDGIRLAQIVTASSQNVTAPSQNVTISKEEKENQKKKEKIKKENENSVCVNNARENTHTSASPQDLIINQLFNMDVLIPGQKPKIHGNTGYYKIIVLEFGLLDPKRYVDEMYSYYNSHVWPQGDKLELMRWWMQREFKMNKKLKPQLNDIERAVLKTFIDHIEERLVVRLLDVVRMFEVTDKIIYFSVPAENVQDFVLWLNTLPLSLWFEAYNRTVSVRPLAPIE